MPREPEKHRSTSRPRFRQTQGGKTLVSAGLLLGGLRLRVYSVDTAAVGFRLERVSVDRLYGFPVCRGGVIVSWSFRFVRVLCTVHMYLGALFCAFCRYLGCRFGIFYPPHGSRLRRRFSVIIRIDSIDCDYSYSLII